MSNTTSLTKIRFFTLIISIISTLALVQFAQAQEESLLTITSEPLVSGFADGNMSFQVEVANESSDSVKFTYAAEVRTPEGDGSTLVDTGGGTNEATLESNVSKILSFTYPVPEWLIGEHDVFVTFYTNNGTQLATSLVDSIIFTGVKPDIEILTESCVFNEENENKFPLHETLTTNEDDSLDMVCLIINNTDFKQTIKPVLTAYAPTLNGAEVASHTGDTLTLTAGEIQEVSFSLPLSNISGSYVAYLSLDTDLRTNTAVAENLTNVSKEKPQIPPPHVATPQESSTTFIVVVTLLALLVLLAILVYRRKSEPLSETFHPIEEDNNLEQ